MTARIPPAHLRSLDEALGHRVEVLPDEPFIQVADSGWLTATDLDGRAAAVAAGLRSLGVQPGDRVATILPNRIEAIETLFATAKLGAILVPLNYWLKGEFLRFQLKDCGARVLIADEAGLSAATPLLDLTEIETLLDVDGSPNDSGPRLSYASFSIDPEFEAHQCSQKTLAAILYTSGTTGMPKGCMLSHGYFLNSGRAYGPREWIAPGDRIFTAWPLFHAGGLLNGLCPTLMTNASAHYEEEFHASTYLHRAREVGATTLMGVGFMGNAILAQPPSDDDRECRFKLAVFPPMTVRKQMQFEERFNTPLLCEGYGQTECLPVTVSKVSGPRNRASLGEIAPSVDVRIADDDGNEAPDGQPGEITVRPKLDECMFQGYWQNPEATATAWRGLWHHTGDRGFKDSDGFLTFVDRQKDAVRRRGENVSSFELEAAIIDHPDVTAVAVTAIPSPVGEDDVKASVVLTEASTVDAAAMFDWFKNNLPYYAIPRYVDVRSSLPTNALGRVMKQSLRDEGVPDGAIDFETLGYAVPREERRTVAASNV